MQGVSNDAKMVWSRDQATLTLPEWNFMVFAFEPTVLLAQHAGFAVIDIKAILLEMAAVDVGGDGN